MTETLEAPAVSTLPRPRREECPTCRRTLADECVSDTTSRVRGEKVRCVVLWCPSCERGIAKEYGGPSHEPRLIRARLAEPGEVARIRELLEITQPIDDVA